MVQRWLQRARGAVQETAGELGENTQGFIEGLKAENEPRVRAARAAAEDAAQRVNDAARQTGAVANERIERVRDAVEDNQHLIVKASQAIPGVGLAAAGAWHLSTPASMKQRAIEYADECKRNKGICPEPDDELKDLVRKGNALRSGIIGTAVMKVPGVGLVANIVQDAVTHRPNRRAIYLMGEEFRKQEEARRAAPRDPDGNEPSR